MDIILIAVVLGVVLVLLPLAFFRVPFALKWLRRIWTGAYIWVGVIIVLAAWRAYQQWT